MRFYFISWILWIAAIFAAPKNLYSQTDVACGTHLLPVSEKVQAFGLQKMYERGDGPNYEILDTAQVLRIPVVFHIVHVGEAIGDSTNISEEQVLSAISALNDDFRRVPGTSGYGAGVDTKIEFCLASTDPNGNSTDGIVRHDGSNLSWMNGKFQMNYVDYGVNAASYNYYGVHDTWLKQTLGPWDTDRYLNVWVVNEIAGNNGGAGIQGYAYLGPISGGRDGIVILYNAVGTVGPLKSYTNMNKTLTHEVGHYLALYHTFDNTGDCQENNCNTEGDRVCDTPVTTSNTNCSSENCPGAIEENYMDYSPQTCRDMYTLGQAERMRACIYELRPGLLNNLGCGEQIDCIYDFNGDLQVDFVDVDILIYDIGCFSCGDTDLNNDGITSVEDLLILLTYIGYDCTSGSTEDIWDASIEMYGDNAGNIASSISDLFLQRGQIIFDMSGRLINKDRDNLSSGMYIVITNSEGKVTSKKISIVK